MQVSFVKERSRATFASLEVPRIRKQKRRDQNFVYGMPVKSASCCGV